MVREKRLRLGGYVARRGRLRFFVLRKALHFLLREWRNCRRRLHLQMRYGQDEDLRENRRLLRGLAAGHFAGGHLIHVMAAVHRHLFTRFGHLMLVAMHFANSTSAAEMLCCVPGCARVWRIQKSDSHQADRRRCFPHSILCPRRHYLRTVPAALNHTPVCSSCQHRLCAQLDS